MRSDERGKVTTVAGKVNEEDKERNGATVKAMQTTALPSTHYRHGAAVGKTLNGLWEHRNALPEAFNRSHAVCDI